MLVIVLYQLWWTPYQKNNWFKNEKFQIIRKKNENRRFSLPETCKREWFGHVETRRIYITILLENSREDEGVI